MRYVYCMECGNPISARSTFEESVIRGVQHRKKLKATCGRSSDNGYCMDCYLKLRRQFGKTECDDPNCRKNNNGHCDYLLEKPLTLE